jgi:hypothetical protein
MATRTKKAKSAGSLSTLSTQPRKQEPVVGTDRGTVFAPARMTVHTHKANDERRQQAAKTLTRDRLTAALKADKDKLFGMLMALEVRPSEVKLAQLAQFNAAQLGKVAKAHGIKGYSGLAKDELVVFLHTGNKPAPKAGSTRQKREVVSRMKKEGLISGPISALKVSQLDDVIAGRVTEVTKPQPNVGTADYHRNLLREGAAKGYSARATAKAKAMFGKSISTLKAEQLKKLCQALGLVK